VLDEYQLVYVSRGGGRFADSAGRDYAVGEGDMILLFPGLAHSYGPDPDTGWDEHWIGFKGPLADRLAARGFIPRDRPVLSLGLRQDFLREYNELIEIAREERPGFQYEMGAIVYRMISRLASGLERAEQHSRGDELAARARAWMEARVEGRLDTGELARALGLSYENFRRIFLRYTGLSPYRYFIQLKMARAEALLEDGSLPVKEVSRRLGFENQYYFSRAFKAHAGRSPGQWRADRRGGRGRSMGAPSAI
jgi:AraC-like DNA-binding protein